MIESEIIIKRATIGWQSHIEEKNVEKKKMLGIRENKKFQARRKFSFENVHLILDHPCRENVLNYKLFTLASYQGIFWGAILKFCSRVTPSDHGTV